MRRIESYKVLSEVYFKDRHAHLVLKELDLSSEDQAFVSALVYTTLQHSLYLDYQFEDFVDAKLPEAVKLIIKMGCAQIFKMDKIPDYAVVNESVDLAKRVKQHRYSGVVNAVLKRVIERGERPLEGNPLEQASIEYSMPLWILKLLSKQYDQAFAIGYAQYCQTIRPSYVRFNTLKPIAEIDDELFGTLNGHPIAKAPLFKSPVLREGYVLIQDINSQEVVKRMDLMENMRVLDCCCGPGTKTSQIAAMMNNTGHIDGVELYASRAQATEELMERANVHNASIHTSDVLDFTSETLYDRILVDAPCSGLGVISHKHDLRYHIKPSDLDDLVVLQKAMLAHVAPMVAVDGILVYSTCTLNKKENERQVADFLANHENYICLEAETMDPLQTQGDGFYIAKLKRTC
ncbi:methyltransferase domain-containing protein [Erysipelothrix sp. HDW6C]|uniref:transcription antitermination factor NusB n=1 Tax=Erysipelothrix sp. HDW6C TaxID=2714930 RepID=UPI00140A4196|nr:transcription antitermination factor NusB [Erysipelothrix sp. HDW6C]QIK70230.1 methyltransferase domain-containing protein [Erysipelothrix sp. HDW6C]